ncbi:MAG: hypothetical protein ACLSFT_04985 [Ruminococcus callidus]
MRLTDACGSSEMELDYGSLKLQKFTETDQAQFSAFTIFDGDVHCETSTLGTAALIWNSGISAPLIPPCTARTPLPWTTAMYS